VASANKVFSGEVGTNTEFLIFLCDSWILYLSVNDNMVIPKSLLLRLGFQHIDLICYYFQQRKVNFVAPLGLSLIESPGELFESLLGTCVPFLVPLGD